MCVYCVLCIWLCKLYHVLVPVSLSQTVIHTRCHVSPMNIDQLFYLGFIPSSWSLPIWNTDWHTGSDQTVEVAKTGNEASIRSKTATLKVIKYWSVVAKAYSWEIEASSNEWRTVNQLYVFCRGYGSLIVHACM